MKEETKMRIQEALDSDLDDVLLVERTAFGYDKEAELVREMLADPTAKPIVSLLAFQDDRVVGHILFTSVRLYKAQDTVSAAILAPLAIVPDAQKRGNGGKLIERGLEILSASGVELVFVLGHPEYYPRHGFQTAGCLGFEAPYPIPEKNADAWMVQALRPGIIGAVTGKVVCCSALDKPEHWRE
ncbi:MAG: N-acetyltransferase [Deltaproteobacteria bacterium]|nr:N-acetyltransferase [Deltaproteobacteria bacterium]